MSAATDSNTTTVFVRLLDEGTEVMRPVAAEQVSAGIYLLRSTDDYDPELEAWEFLPDSLVRCERRMVGGEDILVAVDTAQPSACSE